MAIHQLITHSIDKVILSTEQLEGIQFKAEELLKLTKIVAPEKGELEKYQNHRFRIVRSFFNLKWHTNFY